MIANLVFLTMPNFSVFRIQNCFGSEKFYESRPGVTKCLGSEPSAVFPRRGACLCSSHWTHCNRENSAQPRAAILAGAIGTVTSRGKTLVREKRWRNLKVWQRVDNVLFFLYASKAFSFQDADVGSSVFWPGRGSLRTRGRAAWKQVSFSSSSPGFQLLLYHFN